MLVGQLHRDATAEGVAHDRGPVDAEADEQIAQERRVSAQRVVAHRLVGGAMPQQVRRQHAVPGRQALHRLDPRARAPRDAMDEQDGLPLPLHPVGQLVAIDGSVA
jgi:hypothetical protein